MAQPEPAAYFLATLHELALRECLRSYRVARERAEADLTEHCSHFNYRAFNDQPRVHSAAVSRT
jgi:hypothetical protein